MFCPKCGSQIKEGARFCGKCGYQLGGNASPGAGPAGNAGTGALNGAGMSGQGGAPRGNRRIPGQNGYASRGMGKPPKKKPGIALIVILILAILLGAGAIGGGIYYFISGSSQTEDRDKKDRSDREDERDDEDDGREGDEDDRRDKGEEDDRRDKGEKDDEDDGSAGHGREEEEPETEEPARATEAATEPATTAAPELPATAMVLYASQADMAGMVKAVTVRDTAFQSSYLVQTTGTYDNTAWSAFDGQSTTSWQDGVDGDGIGEYIGISFDREYQVQVVTFMLGNHRSNDWYVKNNAPKTLSVSLGTQTFQVTFPHEMTEFAVLLSRPVPASDIRITVDEVYRGTKYTDTIIAEVGVYGN